MRYTINLTSDDLKTIEFISYGRPHWAKVAARMFTEVGENVVSATEYWNLSEAIETDRDEGRPEFAMLSLGSELAAKLHDFLWNVSDDEPEILEAVA
jgi:hypothetical protein